LAKTLQTALAFQLDSGLDGDVGDLPVLLITSEVDAQAHTVPIAKQIPEARHFCRPE
jgi:hypothetical protein